MGPKAITDRRGASVCVHARTSACLRARTHVQLQVCMGAIKLGWYVLFVAYSKTCTFFRQDVQYGAQTWIINYNFPSKGTFWPFLWLLLFMSTSSTHFQFRFNLRVRLQDRDAQKDTFTLLPYKKRAMTVIENGEACSMTTHSCEQELRPKLYKTCHVT